MSKHKTNHNPSLSVIIPVYNRAGKIGDAIKSVLNQTYEEFELIVVDDASTDDTVEVVRAFDDPRLRLLEHEVNKSGSAARNTGIDAARGEFVTFLDSDDRWEPRKLARQMEEIEELRRQEKLTAKTVLFSALMMETPEAEVRLPVRPPRKEETIREYISMGHGLVHMITLLTTVEFAKVVRFDELLREGDDADFAMRLDAAGGDFVYIDEVLATWQRTGEDHVSGSSNYQSGLDWLQRNPELLTPRQKARYLGAVLSRQAIRAGRKGLALKWVLQGLHEKVLTKRELAELTTALALPPELDARLWSLLRTVYHRVA